LYVTPTCSAVTAVALLLPTPKMPPPAAPARRYAEYQNTPSRPSGNCPTMRGLPIVTSTSWPAFNFVLNSL
jgi:hypothetical protein